MNKISIYQFILRRFCQQTDNNTDNTRQHEQNQSNIKEMHIFDDTCSCINFIARRRWITEVQEHSNDPSKKTSHQSPECSLNKEKVYLSSWLKFLQRLFILYTKRRAFNTYLFITPFPQQSQTIYSRNGR